MFRGCRRRLSSHVHCVLIALGLSTVAITGAWAATPGSRSQPAVGRPRVDTALIAQRTATGDPRLTSLTRQQASAQTADSWCDRCQNCFSDWAKRRVSIKYGMCLPDLSAAPPLRPLIIFIHGLNSRPEDLDILVGDARNVGHLCATFRYPNDQPLADSAKLLSTELSELRRSQPRRPLYLVTHSMGGLVARAVIENPQLDPGGVQRLVMIAPPNQGSELARFAVSLDLYEYVRSPARRREAGPIVGAYADGLSEATRDLRPESEFLTGLNRRPRNAEVQYSLLIGNESWVSRSRVNRAQDWFDRTGARCRWIEAAGKSFDQHIVPLEELFDSEGDGCVAVVRAQLRDVVDVEVGRFSHNGLLFDGQDEEVRRCRAWVLSRLGPGATRS